MVYVVDGLGKFVCFIENDMDWFFFFWVFYMDRDILWIGMINGCLYCIVIWGIDIK